MFRILFIYSLFFILTSSTVSASLYEAFPLYRAKKYREALSEFEKQPQNDPVASFFKADIYCNALDVDKNSTKCLELLKISADYGFSPAHYLLGKFYLYGIYLPQDEKKAASHLLAASIDDYRAYLLLQIKLKGGGKVEKRDMKLLNRELYKAAKKGNPKAAATLAFTYLTGDQQPRNLKEEIRWLKAASDKNPQAALSLSLIYFYGDSVTKDLKEAFIYMQKGGMLGDPRSSYYLGTFYYNGYGVDVNYEASAYWFKQSAEAGDSDAELAYSLMLLSGRGVEKDRAKAVEWLSKAASAGNSQASAILKDLLSYRGDGNFSNDISERLLGKRGASKSGDGEDSLSFAEVKGRGFMLDKGNFGIKFSLPNIYDAASPRGEQPKNIRELWDRLQGGTFDLIFRP